MELPRPQGDELALLERMQAHLGDLIDAAGGTLPFDGFMDAALYAPGLGYYVNGRRRFGAQGDFVTAPELSPLFARALAAQVAQGLRAIGCGEILEVGAGSGRLAADLLAELERLQQLPGRYLILDLSPDLRAQQAETLLRLVPHLVERVVWLDALPVAGFNGVVLANELLDALPVQRFRRMQEGFEEQYVARRHGQLVAVWDRPHSPGLAVALQRLDAAVGGFAQGYVSEINLRLAAWLRALAAGLQRAAVLLIDYGYSRREYYHPQRSSGTLICHYRHHAFADALLLPGLADITANIDFTAAALAAQAAGLAVAGYTTQANFLFDCGLERLLGEFDPQDVGTYLPVVQGVKQLTLPTGMGERFKVLALTKELDIDLLGFRSRDLRAYL